jgi:acyl-CoA thioesterase-1
LKPAFSYLALGDSITVGAGAPAGKGYVDRIACRLAKQVPLKRADRICRGGWRCANLSRALSSLPSADGLIQNASLITLYIGGNNLLFAWFKYLLLGRENILDEAIDNFADCFDRLLNRLVRFSSARLVTFNLYNPFPKEPLARHYIPWLNETIALLSASYRIPVIDVHSAFDGLEHALVAGYRTGRFQDALLRFHQLPIHPNAEGHRQIATEFWRGLFLEPL